MATTGAQAMTEFCEQVNPRVLRALRDAETRRMRPGEMLRVQESWVAAAEKRALLWLAARTPERINPDHLTVLGLASQIGAGACYALALWNRYALLGVIVCLALNWLGDSLDGTLARVRQRQRPRYGFYVDHMVDSFGALALMGGLALSGYMHPVIAIGLLIAFLMLSIQSYLATHTLGEFRISFWRFGPTELRILLAVGNLFLFWKPEVHLLGRQYRLFDVGGAIGLGGMMLMVIFFTVKNTMRLYREEKDPRMTGRMTANSRWDNQLEEIRRRVEQRQFWQDVAATQVTPDELGKNTGGHGDSPGENVTNSCADNEMRTSAPCAANSIPRNTLAAKDLREFKRQKSEPKSDAEGGNSISPSKLVRFSKFNLVGGIGIAVQFAALFLLKSVFNFNYLVATALAVETAVLHNFVWHERFTWVDRLTPAPDQRTSGAKARILSRLVRGAEAPLFHGCHRVCSSGLKRCAAPNPWRSSFARLVRFHLGNGAVSILGNLALMKVMVGQGHMNYLVANAIAITLCSLANFLVSDAWVFARD